jgi:hypothetical protein
VVRFGDGPDVDAIASFLCGAAFRILQQAPCHAVLIEETYGRENRNFQLFAQATLRADKYQGNPADNPCRVDYSKPISPEVFCGSRCLPLGKINVRKEMPNDCVSTSNVRGSKCTDRIVRIHLHPPIAPLLFGGPAEPALTAVNATTADVEGSARVKKDAIWTLKRLLQRVA